MALSVRHEEFHVHPGVDPGKAVLCCGFLQTLVYRTLRTFGGTPTYPGDLLTSCLHENNWATVVFWTGIADGLAEDFPTIDFVVLVHHHFLMF